MNAPAAKPDFARAAARLARTPSPGARERRRFFRAPIVVGGRMLDPLGREQDCRTADISPGDARVAAPSLPEIGQRVVLYLEDFGRIAGHVARRCGEGEVAVIFESSAHKREKLAEALTWAINKIPLGLEQTDRRDRPPACQRSELARIETESGQAYEGEVLDFSLAGMTLRTPQPAPPIGAWVRVGGIHGRVSRRIEGGFAIDFEPSPDAHGAKLWTVPPGGETR